MLFTRNIMIATLLLGAVTLSAADFSLLKKPRTLAVSPVSSGKTVKSGGFTQCDSLWVTAPVDTVISAVEDGKNLCLRFDMQEKPENMVYLHGREKHEIKSWSNNLVEALIQPPEGQKGNFWYHIAVDCAGHIYFARENEVSEMPGTVKSKELDASQLRTRVKLRKDGWEAVVVIPFSLLGSSPGNGTWKANFGRTRNIKNTVTYYAWSKTKGYQEYQNFGTLSFGENRNAEELEKEFLLLLTEYQSARKNMVAGLKQRSYTWKYAFGNAENYRSLLRVYTPETGYGWMESGVEAGAFDPQKARDWNRPINSLCDNYVFCGTPGKDGKIVNHFRVDLPNGSYKVHLLAGHVVHEHLANRFRFTVSAQGKEIRRYDIGTVMYARDFFPVEVTDGKLILTFDGAVEFPDRPETVDWAGKGKLAESYRPGWMVNAICIYPVSERKAAEKQIATDQLELLKTSLGELARWEEVVVREKDIPYSAGAKKQGMVFFTRPLGDLLYPGSRPKAKEIVSKITLRAVPGEPVNIPIGLLPLADSDQAEITVDAPWLIVYEALPIAWKLDGGKFGMIPWSLDDYRYCDHDLNQGETRFLWIAGIVPENSAPGKLQVVLNVTPKGKARVTLPLEIEVLPIRLNKRDFKFGGDFCEGYNKPIRIYDDRILTVCRRWGVNTATLNLFRPERPGSSEELDAQIAFLKKINYPLDYVIFYPAPFLQSEDIPLREKKIDKLSDKTMEYYREAGAWALQKMKENPGLRLIYYFMDEAHCKGEPYWTEQIRVLKMLRETYPTLHLMASESHDSFWRSKPYVDYPRLHEMEDFNLPDFDGKFLSVYPNQLALGIADINGARFTTGWQIAVTKIRGVYMWQLFEQLQVYSGLRGSHHTMFTQSGVGGYRVMPRLTTVMGQVGLYDQYYYFTLLDEIAEVKSHGNHAQKKAAEKIEKKLEMIRKGIKPSYIWYSRNGGVWPSKSFVALREIIVNSLLELNRLKAEN